MINQNPLYDLDHTTNSATQSTKEIQVKNDRIGFLLKIIIGFLKKLGFYNDVEYAGSKKESRNLGFY
jgi:hypothetical protein